jgi:prolipoprotein diacylglyceryltransferase
MTSPTKQPPLFNVVLYGLMFILAIIVVALLTMMTMEARRTRQLGEERAYREWKQDSDRFWDSVYIASKRGTER